MCTQLPAASLVPSAAFLKAQPRPGELKLAGSLRPRRTLLVQTAFFSMSPPLSDGEYLLTGVQWRRQDRDESTRPLHGFTTGHLVVDGGRAQVEARFNDQFLSNRFSDLEEDGSPVVLLVEVLEADGMHPLACGAPTLVRAGASYQLQVEGEFTDASHAHSR